MSGGGTDSGVYGMGIELVGVDIDTIESGTVTLLGIGNNGKLGNMGVKVAGNSNVTSVDGAILIEGTSNGSTVLNHGVHLATGSKVGASGLGAVTVTGIGEQLVD